MNKYFLVSVRFNQIDENGREKRETKQIMMEALSFTECEAKILQHIGADAEPHIVAIKRSNASAIIEDQHYKFYMCKVKDTISDDKGKEKYVKSYYLVDACSIEQARKTMGVILEYNFTSVIESISETKIWEVI